MHFPSRDQNIKLTALLYSGIEERVWIKTNHSIRVTMFKNNFVRVYATFYIGAYGYRFLEFTPCACCKNVWAEDIQFGSLSFYSSTFVGETFERSLQNRDFRSTPFKQISPPVSCPWGVPSLITTVLEIIYYVMAGPGRLCRGIQTVYAPYMDHSTIVRCGLTAAILWHSPSMVHQGGSGASWCSHRQSTPDLCSKCSCQTLPGMLLQGFCFRFAAGENSQRTGGREAHGDQHKPREIAV